MAPDYDHISTPGLALIALALVVLTWRFRTLFGFLLTIIAVFVLAVRVLAAADLPAAQSERISLAIPEPRPPLVAVPEPDPAAVGVLLDRWSRSSAPLAPLWGDR
jgi:hypothetical protein